jgi:hypothetical protein
MKEGSGSVSMNNGSGCGLGWPKNIWILWIRGSGFARLDSQLYCYKNGAAKIQHRSTVYILRYKTSKLGLIPPLKDKKGLKYPTWGPLDSGRDQKASAVREIWRQTSWIHPETEKRRHFRLWDNANHTRKNKERQTSVLKMKIFLPIYRIECVPGSS